MSDLDDECGGKILVHVVEIYCIISIETSNRSEIVGWEKHLFYDVNVQFVLHVSLSTYSVVLRKSRCTKCMFAAIQWHYANWIENHRLHDSSNYY